jgi:hypothetical protein
MSPEWSTRLQERLDSFMDCFVKATGCSDWTETISTLKVQVAQKPSFAVFAHEMAQDHPATVGNTVDPNLFGQILRLIETPELYKQTVVGFSDEEAAQLDSVLEQLMTQELPATRQRMTMFARGLPQRRAGGRPPEVDNPEKADQICSDIAQLVRDGLSPGKAQKRVAGKYGFSARLIRRIWQDRKNRDEKFAETET